MSVFKDIAQNLAKAFHKVTIAPVVRLYNHQQAYHGVTYPGHDPVNPKPTLWDRDFSHLLPRQNPTGAEIIPYQRLVK